jgi:drug/metabolite transporter (DMT)-like permease
MIATEPVEAKPPSPVAFVFAFAAIYLIWGSTYLAIRVAVATLPPFLLSGARFMLAGLILAVWLAATKGFRPTARQWRDNALIGAFLLAGGNGMVVWSEQSIPSGITTLVISVNPLLFVLGEWMLPRGRRPAAATFFGIALGLAGLLLLVSPGGAAAVSPRHCAAILAACLCWTTGSLYSRYTRDPAEPLTGATMQMLCGSSLMLLIALARGEVTHFTWAQVTPRAAVAWIYLVGAGSLVGYSSYVWLLKHSTPARASTYAYVNPIVAVFLGWRLLGEPLTPRTLIASVVIVTGVVIITWQKIRPKPAPAGAAVRRPG